MEVDEILGGGCLLLLIGATSGMVSTYNRF